MSARNHTVTKVVLKNGAEGLLIDVAESTVMAMAFNFRAGHYLMPDEKWETPHIMEHMAFGANKKFDRARKFQEEYEKNGAYCNASTSDYHVTYETECADFEWDRILDLILLSISEPKFIDEEFKSECGNVYDERVSRSNNRAQMLSIALSKAQGYRAFQHLEAAELMKNVTLDDIKNHYKNTHTSTNMRFIIAGHLNGRTEKIIKKIEQSNLNRGNGRIELPDEFARKMDRPILINKEDVANVYFDISTYTTDSFDDNEWVAASMVNSILTGTLYSRILGEARERGLVYHLASNFSHTKNQVGWWISGQAQQVNLPLVLEIAQREIKKVCDGHITDKDLEAVKQYSLGGFQRSAQTVFNVASGYANRYFFEDIIDDYYSVPKRIESVKKEDLIDVMQRVFKNASWGMGLLGSADDKLLNTTHKIMAPLWHS